MNATLSKAYAQLDAVKKLLDDISASDHPASHSMPAQSGHFRVRAKQRGDIRQNMRRSLSKMPVHELTERADWYAQFLADGGREEGEVSRGHLENVVAILDEFIRRALWAQPTT